MRICHFGGFDSGYARSVVFSQALALRGHEVVDCSSRHPGVVRRQLEALAATAKMGSSMDAIVVGTVAHYSMPLAYALARTLQKPLVFDIFDSIWEACVYDNDQLPPSALKARYLRRLDQSMAMLADLAVVDTALHANFFVETIGVSPTKMRHVPVGVDTRRFSPRAQTDHRRDAKLTIGFVGSFYKSHGIDTILKAAATVEQHVPSARFDFYGDGPVTDEVKRLARELGLQCTTFHGRVPYAEVPNLVAQFDVVLGLFGATEKVMHVVPNKAYEAAAMAKPLITGDTPAMRAAFTPHEEVELVPLADEQALAQRLLDLLSSPTRRDQMSRAIYRRFDADYSLHTIGAQWEHILSEAQHLHRGSHT